MSELAEITAARNAGITLSSENSGDEWKQYAIDFVHDYLTTHETLFADDLWDAGLQKPTSPRALGAVMQHASKEGWMEQIEHKEGIVARPSKASHWSIKPVWKSLIYKR